MKSRVGSAILISVIWVIVVAYIAYAALLGVRYRREQSVTQVLISILNSTESGQLVTSHAVREWILRSGIPTIGTRIDEVDVVGIRETIVRNGFVDKVNVYCNTKGELHIDVSQRRPMARLLLDGYNLYVTKEGFVFNAPSSSALYVPVITGDYKLLVPPTYEGRISDFVAQHYRENEERVLTVGEEKYKHYLKIDEYREQRRAIRRERISKQWGESSEEFAKRVEEKRKDKRLRVRACSGSIREQERMIDAITQRQEAIRSEHRKLVAEYEDFMRLLDFVARIEKNSYWRSEIVQIIASKSSAGRITLDFIPRSGDFRIVFGELSEDCEERLDKLARFYEEGLSHIGWDKFRVLNVKYKNQVVCTK